MKSAHSKKNKDKLGILDEAYIGPHAIKFSVKLSLKSYLSYNLRPVTN